MAPTGTHPYPSTRGDTTTPRETQMLLTKHQQDIIKEAREQRELEQTWDIWLKRMGPSHVGTLSFSRSTTHEEASRAFRAYFIKVNCRAGGGTRAVAATERCPTSGRIHIHCLLFGTECIRVTWLEEKWSHGNRNRLEIFDPTLGRGALYAVKGCITNNDGVLTFLPNIWRPTYE